MSDQLRVVVPTDKPLERAAQAVEEALAQRRFGVLWALDVNAKLAEKGLDLVARYRILEVCSAAHAKEALEANPAVSSFLPCKVVVSQVDGRTEISMPRPTALIGLLGEPRLRPLAEEVEGVIVEAVREAAG